MKRLIPILLLIFCAQILIGCTDGDFPRYLTDLEPVRSESLSLRGKGTGFIVSQNYILTAGHVIDPCKKVTVTKDSQQIESRALAVSKMADLGLLTTKRYFEDVAKFRRQHISTGKTILKYGYSAEEPTGGWTKGSITSQWGINYGRRSDINLLQYDAITHRGNSGGPILDQSGHVVGIVVSSSGPTLSNAVNSNAAEFFLSTNFVMYEEGDSTQDLNLQAVARQAKDFTVLVECWQ